MLTIPSRTVDPAVLAWVQVVLRPWQVDLFDSCLIAGFVYMAISHRTMHGSIEDKCILIPEEMYPGLCIALQSLSFPV